MRCTVETLPAQPITFPQLRVWTAPGHSRVVVMFTAPRQGVCLHSAGSPNWRTGEVAMCIDITSPHWQPVASVTLIQE